MPETRLEGKVTILTFPLDRNTQWQQNMLGVNRSGNNPASKDKIVKGCWIWLYLNDAENNGNIGRASDLYILISASFLKSLH